MYVLNLPTVAVAVSCLELRLVNVVPILFLRRVGVVNTELIREGGVG